MDFKLGLSKKNHFKSSYNWFKIDIIKLDQPLTAIFSPGKGRVRPPIG